MRTPAACGIIFDLDGVIVDTAAGHFASFVRLGEEAGFAMSREQFTALFGRHNNDIFPILYRHPLSPEQLASLQQRKEEIFREIVRGQLQALPGVPQLIPALAARGFHLAIGSSTPRENIDLVLDELRLADCFQAIAGGDDVTRGKPDPQVFLIAAERLGIAPAHCVVVEDAVAGVQAALSGGMKALAVTTNHPREALAHAHRVVDSLAEVTPDDFLRLLAVE
jgi:beta-phosphoglucomutase